MNADTTRSASLAVAAWGLALILLLAAGSAGAAERDLAGRWGLGLESGLYKLTGGDLDHSTLDQFAGFQINRGLSREWSLQLALRYGYVRPGVGSVSDGDVGWSGTSGAPLYTPMFQPMLRLQRRFAPASTFQPFVGAGVGLTSWKVLDLTGQDVGLVPSGDPASGFDANGDPAELKGTDLTLGLELGLDIVLSDNWALTLGGRVHLMPSNIKDNVGASALWGAPYVDANTAGAEAFVGLGLWFGNKDRDRDGIPNDRDACPDQAEDRDGFRDDDGCPDVDNDEDGIADASDGCPDEAEDRDGYADEDGCPDPDNDGDGIVDGSDACPDEPEDIDGYRDDDGCPDPDNDNDGVEDARDRCPDTPEGVKVDADGCAVAAAAPAPVAPLAPPLPVAGQTIVLEGVNFESGSARLTADSRVRLDEVAATLQANPEVVIEVRGHTDSLGSSDANLDLSQRRATAVRDALVLRGVAPARVRAVGYGEDFPVADNGTPAGRAANRRVELHRVE